MNNLNLYKNIIAKESNLNLLAENIKHWSKEFGFSSVGITDIDLSDDKRYLDRWLEKGYHGEMEYMERNTILREKPSELVKGTKRIISVTMNYLPESYNGKELLQKKDQAFVSGYARGRDYHKLMRSRLKKLAKKIKEYSPHENRVFVDSAPILEKAIARKAGLGWIGKNTLLINKNSGSYFFLGEIYTDLELPVNEPHTSSHCGTCSSCMDICPTKAFEGPYKLDARKCISYLTIEHKGSIDEDLRPLMGNRIFGCDDCQIYCPWNKFTNFTEEEDFKPRHNLDDVDLCQLFMWSEADFYIKTEGSPIRRAGYEGWLRNLAIALGNANYSEKIVFTLKLREDFPSEIVREHVIWALEEQRKKNMSDIEIKLEPQDEYNHAPDEATNYNESMYFNVFDHDKKMGGWFRLGNRVNEGYAEMTCCIYLPDGRIGFMFGRPEISTNEVFDAGGMKFEVVDPFKSLRVQYKGKILLLDNPIDMLNPSKAFKENPRVECEADIAISGISPMFGGQAVRKDGKPLERDSEKSFSKAHYEQHTAGKGTIKINGDEWHIDGLGLRDKSWGPRYWQAIEWYRWLTININDEIGFMFSIVHQSEDSERRGGIVLKDGKYEIINDCKIDTVYDENHFQKTFNAWAKTEEGEYEVQGKVLSLIPLRNRRNTPEGESLVTRITEGMTEYTYNGIVGYGMSEYLDQVIDGKPIGP